MPTPTGAIKNESEAPLLLLLLFQTLGNGKGAKEGFLEPAKEEEEKFLRPLLI